jgi:hypothetical protein
MAAACWKMPAKQRWHGAVDTMARDTARIMWYEKPGKDGRARKAAKKYRT